MKALVTGAAGFIASHLTERLLSGGQAVVGLDNFDDFYDPAIKERNLRVARDHADFSLVRGDIRDPETLARLPAEIDTVIHIAARAGVRPSIANPVLYYDVNVGGTLGLLEFARERGITRFVSASSSSVYGNNEKVPFSEEDRVDNPISPYAATKKATELLCHTYTHLYGITCLNLRFFTVYGPRQRPDLAIHKFARLLAAGEEIPMFGDGTTQRDYTYIDDILQGVEGGIRWVGENDGAFEIVNLGESRTIGLMEMIGVLGEEMGTEPRIRRLPLQPGDVDRTYADITKARRLLGYAPRWEFREGVREFVRWLRQ
ncbi:MAG: GDP-mannose 4,6-dehydratase [Longimicrobiales bacterium]